MMSLSIMCEKYYQDSVYGMTDRKPLQHHSDDQTAISQPISSRRDPHPLSPPTNVSSYHSESNYTGYNGTNGHEIESNSDQQSNSYCASQVPSQHDGIDVPFNIPTFMSETYSDQDGQTFAGPGYQTSATLPKQFDHPFTRLDTLDFDSYNETSLDEYLPSQFSTNGYLSIGSRFQFGETLDLEENPFMDLGLSQELSTESVHNLNVTKASQIDSEDYVLPFDLNFRADGLVPPASTACAYANSPYCDASISVEQICSAIVPIHANICIASTPDYLLKDPATLSTNSLSTASVTTGHCSGSSNLSNPCNNAASRAKGTRNSPHHAVASPAYSTNGISSDVVPMVGASSSSLPTLHHRIRKTSRSLAPSRNLQPGRLQTVDHEGNDKHAVATASGKPPHHPTMSASNFNSRDETSKCPKEGCRAIRKGLDQRENLRTHMRDVHEKPAPPTCEICGKVYVKNDSLKRHIRASHHAVKLPEGARIVCMRKADGTVYATYAEVHDYVKVKNGKKA